MILLLLMCKWLELKLLFSLIAMLLLIDSAGAAAALVVVAAAAADDAATDDVAAVVVAALDLMDIDRLKMGLIKTNTPTKWHRISMSMMMNGWM